MAEKKAPSILPLAAALAALPGAAGMVVPAAAAVPSNSSDTIPAAKRVLDEPNAFVSTGEDLLSFTIHKSADGTIVADHHSHASHSSHSSHSSHYSSR